MFLEQAEAWGRKERKIKLASLSEEEKIDKKRPKIKNYLFIRAQSAVTIAANFFIVFTTVLDLFDFLNMKNEKGGRVFSKPFFQYLISGIDFE